LDRRDYGNIHWIEFANRSPNQTQGNTVMRLFALSFVAAAFVLTQTAQATDPESLQVQDIELGMSLNDARTELVERGYEKRLATNRPPSTTSFKKHSMRYPVLSPKAD